MGESPPPMLQLGSSSHCSVFLVSRLGLQPESISSTLPCFGQLFPRPLCCSPRDHSLTASGRAAFVLPPSCAPCETPPGAQRCPPCVYSYSYPVREFEIKENTSFGLLFTTLSPHSLFFVPELGYPNLYLQLQVPAQKPSHFMISPLRSVLLRRDGEEL